MKTLRIFKPSVVVGASFVLIILAMVGTWIAGTANDKHAGREITEETVVVAAQSDPYSALAQKIARIEKLESVQNLSEALQFNPRFVIVVAAPANLTKEWFREAGQLFKDSDDYPGLGIITGSTIEKAEQLWARKDLPQGNTYYVAGDVETTQQVYRPTLFDISNEEGASIELNKGNLIRALQQADYIYWARHAGARTFFWNTESQNWGENDQLSAKDLPALGPVVIYAPACDNLRPWMADSIALGFVDSGAAAYVGHTNSPFTNAFLKRGLAVPGPSSWKEFPLGLVVQIQSRATTRNVFTLPQLFMLGDPRIYLSKEKPYRIISDTSDPNGKRVLTGESSVNGVLAVKIDGGSMYEFVAVQGLTASDDGLFDNTRLDSMNLARDKYLLMLHDGGAFRIELARQAPWGWRWVDAITDALDYSWVVLWLNIEVDNGPLIYAVSLLLFCAILLFKRVVRKRSIEDYRKLFLVALLLAVLRVVYFLLRIDDYTVSANYANSTPYHIVLGGLGVFANVSAGLILIQDASKRLIQALGILLAVLPQFLLTGFYLVLITFMNTLIEVNKATFRGMYDYRLFWLPFVVLVFEVLLILGTYLAVSSVQVPWPARLRTLVHPWIPFRKRRPPLNHS